MEATAAKEAPFRESTAPLLRPPQVHDIEAEVSSIKSTQAQPAHVLSGVDMGEMQRKLSQNLAMLRNAPAPYGTAQIDLARAREAELRTQFTAGMPTAAEMRRNPPGAVDKHRAWEARNKKAIAEWKNIRLRLHASGAVDGQPIDSQDIANFELFRPHGGAQEMDLSVAQINRPITMLPPAGTEATVTVMTPEREAALKAFDPALHAKVATLNNDQRVYLFNFIDQLIDSTDDAIDMVAAKQARSKK